MRLLPAAILASAALLAPSLAHAGRFAVGVSLGRTQTEADASLDASSTAALWGRVGFGKRFGLDLELGKISTEDDTTRIRTLNLVGRMSIADLHGGAVHPMVLIGLGTDSTDAADYTHGEFGAAIEVDLAKDFVLGADFRFGDRTVDAQPAVDGLTDPVTPQPAFRQPYDLTDGSYRAGRLYLGVRL
ncbi:MAG: outer membrane beta-barrel protein [Myxococcales bacterium]|nr:outer membrane beta-barrel protein [Myxococcales bacterium]